MNNEEKILEMLAAMQGSIAAMQGSIAAIQAEQAEMRSELREVHDKLDDLAESHEETRASVNAILDWTDKVSAVHDFPIPRI